MPKDNSIKSVLIIGSGPIIIGQACEFDYAGSQAALSLKDEGISVSIINSNPATIMTDKVIADHVYLLPVYPARELPIAGVKSEMIAQRMDDRKGTCCSKEELLAILADQKFNGDELSLLITAGAGDIDTLVDPIKTILENANKAW